MLRALITAVVLMGLAPAAASALEYPGQARAPVELDPVLRAAEAHWRALGVTPCRLTVWVADDLTGGDVGQAAGRGDGATCEVWLLREWLDEAVDPGSLELAAIAATIAFHEVGHAYGLPHGWGSVMGTPGEADPEWEVDRAPATAVHVGRRMYRSALRNRGMQAEDIRSAIAMAMEGLPGGPRSRPAIQVHTHGPRWP